MGVADPQSEVVAGSGRPPGVASIENPLKGGTVNRSIRGEHDQVAAIGCRRGIDADVAGLGGDYDVLENLCECCDFGTCKRQLSVIDEIRNVHTVLFEDSTYVCQRFHSRQVPRHAHPAKGVADDQITAVVIEPRKAQSAVLDAHLKPGLGS